jgi:hypothetical protein
MGCNNHLTGNKNVVKYTKVTRRNWATNYPCQTSFSRQQVNRKVRLLRQTAIGRFFQQE